MSKSIKNFFYAKNISDVLYQINSIQDLEILGGCTQINEYPENSLSIRKIPELSEIKKTERFFEFGPAVTISRIEELQNAKLPSIIQKAIKTIANKNIRNIATIGGNICSKPIKHTLFAPLLALDTRLIIRNSTEEKIILLNNINEIPKNWIISKIRIPLDEWEVSIFRRLGPSNIINENSASFAFLANSQKGQLANLRIAFAGSICIRSQELENKLIGTHLPLSEKNIIETLEDASMYFDTIASEKKINSILKAQFLNLLKYSLEQLT